MLVLAIMHFAAGSAPVRIRDMSRQGALIETPVMPPIGSVVRLCRSNLSLSGKVIWVKGARAGLLFEGLASISDWLPRRSTPGQQLADRLFQEMRESERLRIPADAAPTVVEPAAVTASDLTNLQQAIEALAEDLADDPAILMVHGHKLQTLDLAAQILGKLARQIDLRHRAS